MARRRKVVRYRRNWRPLVALASVALLAWALSALVYLGPFGGADATRGAVYRDEHLHLAVQREDGEWYNVAIDFLMFDDGHGNFAAQAEAARREMLGRFPGALEVRPGEVSAQFVQSGYWWPSRNVTWGYNAAGKPAGLSGDSAAIAAAAGSWGASGANFHFAGGATSTGNTAACGSSAQGLDGQNTVGWGAQSGSVLAVTCTWYGGGSPATAAEFDMQIDPDWQWTTGGSINVDLQSVVTHEFGHALGLNHSDDGGAVMFASYCGGCNKRALTADDVGGVLAVYGSAAAPTPTATPTSAPTSTPTPVPPTPTPVFVPAPSATAPPDFTQLPRQAPTATPTATAFRPPVAPTATPKAPPPPVGGAGAPPASLPLLPGANLLAWPNADGPAAGALGSQAGTLAAVYAYDAATATWLRYFPGLPPYASNLRDLHRGQAYWFIATGAGEILVP